MNIRTLSIISIVGALTLGSLSAQRPPQAGPVEVNGIAAKVNGSVITKNQVTFMLAPVFAQLSTQYPRRDPRFMKEMEEAQENIMQELIDRQIILDEFKQLGAKIQPHFIDQEIERQIRTLYNGDESKFREELKRSRMTMPGYREMTKEKMVVQAMRAEQFADAPPPLPNEIQKEYGEMKLSLRDTTKDVITFRKIFIPSRSITDPTATPESQLEFAEKLHTQIVGGADFGELAKEHSGDAYAEQGGLQEDIPRTDLAPEFAAIVFDAKDGDVIEPMLDPRGFTIVKVIKIDYGPSPSLSEPQVRRMVEERVRKRKTSAQYDRWIESRRKRAMIDMKK